MYPTCESSEQIADPERVHRALDGADTLPKPVPTPQPYVGHLQDQTQHPCHREERLHQA